jgi:hypothetical protein
MPRIVKLILAAVVSGIALAGAALLVTFFVLDGDDYVDLAWRLEVQGSRVRGRIPDRRPDWPKGRLDAGPDQAR